MNRILCFLFTAMLCAAADPTSKTNANLQKILKRFPAADANKDGVLTRAELLAQVDAKFAKADTDRNGQLSEAERKAEREKK